METTESTKRLVGEGKTVVVDKGPIQTYFEIHQVREKTKKHGNLSMLAYEDTLCLLTQ